MTNETAPGAKWRRKKWKSLSEWVGNRPQREAAADLGTTQALVQRVVSGASVPSLETAALIHARTRGEVPWWVHLSEERRIELFGPEGQP